jgi:dihydrofolate reductase
MKLIIAFDPNGGIGYDSRLPWTKLQGDLPRFKELTTGKSIVMGRNTWESLPKKPLPNRTNYVFSSIPLDGAITLSDPVYLSSVSDAWIIGGAKVIESCWDYIDEIHASRTFAEYTCDTFIDLVKLENEFMCWFKEDFADHSYEIWKRK